VPTNAGRFTVTWSAQFCADADEAQADFAPPGANPQAINVAIEANERNKRLLRNMIILLFVGLDTGVTGNQYRESNSLVSLRIGRVMVSSVITEEGLGVFYLFDYYWRRMRKHVAVIFFCFRRWNCSALRNLRGGKNC
jgi:hypothetical protein